MRTRKIIPSYQAKEDIIRSNLFNNLGSSYHHCLGSHPPLERIPAMATGRDSHKSKSWGKLYARHPTLGFANIPESSR